MWYQCGMHALQGSHSSPVAADVTNSRPVAVSRKAMFPSADWVTSLAPSLLSYFLHHWAGQWYEYQAAHICQGRVSPPQKQGSQAGPPPRHSVACVWGCPICCSGSMWGHISKCSPMWHFVHATTIRIMWPMHWELVMYRLNSQTGSRGVACDVTGSDQVTITCPFEHQDTLQGLALIMGAQELLMNRLRLVVLHELWCC